MGASWAFQGLQEDKMVAQHTYRPPVKPNPTPQEKMETYARQTRTATVVLAVLASLVFAVTVVGGIVIGIRIGQVNNLSTSTVSSNCMSQGGTDPSC
jgi:hypothetical protein